MVLLLTLYCCCKTMLCTPAIPPYSAPTHLQPAQVFLSSGLRITELSMATKRSSCRTISSSFPLFLSSSISLSFVLLPIRSQHIRSLTVVTLLTLFLRLLFHHDFVLASSLLCLTHRLVKSSLYVSPRRAYWKPTHRAITTTTREQARQVRSCYQEGSHMRSGTVDAGTPTRRCNTDQGWT